MEIKKATRKATPAIICFYGQSGSGKTYSALTLAKGLIGDNRICLIDTENGRASHYADEFDFDVIDLAPPFTPFRYIQAVTVAQKAGYKAIIIDSISHEWEGTGGLLEQAEQSSSKNGLQAWAKPKADHRKLMNMLLQSKSHIIFCARAKYDLEQVVVNGKKEIVNKGLIPIQEKNFPFEMLITFKMEEKGNVFIKKCVKSLEATLQIKENEYISEKHGKIIANWICKGEVVDLEVKELKNEAREVAISGLLSLKNWVKNLTSEQQIVYRRFDSTFKTEIQTIAEDSQASETITSDQGIEIEELCKQANIDIEKICTSYSINSIIDLPNFKFENCKARLTASIAKLQSAKVEVKNENN